MDNDKTIVFMNFNTLGEASIVKGAMESNNIHCFLSNENNPFVGTLIAERGVLLHIFEKDKEKAEELMEIINSAAEEEDGWEENELDDVND
ncbi:MAG TPA: DUF2007 domain-containing protein [Bacteroidales bacterium]